MQAALAPEVAAVYLEKDDEPELVDRYGVINFPTLVWLDPTGEVVSMTVLPEDSETALSDLAFLREWLADEDLAD